MLRQSIMLRVSLLYFFLLNHVKFGFDYHRIFSQFQMSAVTKFKFSTVSSINWQIFARYLAAKTCKSCRFSFSSSRNVRTFFDIASANCFKIGYWGKIFKKKKKFYTHKIFRTSKTAIVGKKNPSQSVTLTLMSTNKAFRTCTYDPDPNETKNA